MAVIKRLTRLFRADLHAVLDRVEEPDILLRQAIREMEDDLARDDQAYRRNEREHEQLAKKESEFRQLHAALGEELDVCFAADKEDLARSLIRRRLETEGFLQLLARRHETLTAQRDQLAQRLAENRMRYEGMRQKAELFDERKGEPAPDSVDSWPSADVRVRDEDVEVALLKERQRRAGR